METQGHVIKPCITIIPQTKFFCATTIVASSENSAEIARNPNVAIRARYVGIIIAKNIT